MSINMYGETLPNSWKIHVYNSLSHNKTKIAIHEMVLIHKVFFTTKWIGKKGEN